MMRLKTLALALTAVATLSIAFAATSDGAIVLDAFSDGASSVRNGNFQVTLSGFDATSSDKLVVLVGAAAGNGVFSVPGITSVTYNGVSMLQATQATGASLAAGGGRAVGIFYLDSDSFSGSGNIVVTFSSGTFTNNGFDIGAFALSGTAAGYDDAGSSSAFGSTASSASLTVGSNGSFVAAVNAYGATPSGTLTALGSDPLARGYELDVDAGSYTASFTGGNVTAVASFAPVVIPEPASLAMGLVGLAMIAARRRCV